jgi:hypothetical protein
VLIDGNVSPAQDLPGLHRGATSGLPISRILPPMHEHQPVIDSDRAAALDILLLLADAEARWTDYQRALDLLFEAEDAGCVLPPEYRMKRHAWDAALGA